MRPIRVEKNEKIPDGTGQYPLLPVFPDDPRDESSQLKRGHVRESP